MHSVNRWELYAADTTKPFALNEKMSIVDLGARLGGGTRAVAERYKVWVTGMDRTRNSLRPG